MILQKVHGQTFQRFPSFTTEFLEFQVVSCQKPELPHIKYTSAHLNGLCTTGNFIIGGGLYVILVRGVYLHSFTIKIFIIYVIIIGK